ncbi:RES domain-containing protein [Nocardia sp. CA2R105]|uniref:HEPN-associated N-terminal domain-containing protein n=1 Tax=Nocardia coffeae TaxID=2873381 RepID=UPI001CA6F7AE|nr:HEPN-associated N-terminal domain-containing protein [Nocardia coffeae]MBY8861230.1 RES domain-containing protein [Nocardia coffeae]
MGFTKRYMEEIEARGFGETGDKTVCLKCIHDDTLREETHRHLTEMACSFCGASVDDASEPIAALFEDFMYIVVEAVRFLYMSVDDAGLVYDEGEWFGGEVLESAEVAYAVCEGDVTYDVLDAIGDVIVQQLWTESHIAESTPDKALAWGWEAFCEKVKHESRFVYLSTAEESSEHPDDFTAASLLSRLEKIIVDNEILLAVPAGRVFWRGRLADEPGTVVKFKTAAALGSPPKERASNSRMSPAGISMFYGSEDIDTVVAEIGAHSTRRYAIVGAFETARDMTLLNLADLPPVPSLYRDRGRGLHYYELKFLRSFAADLGKPIIIDGREHIEYVPTQVVTEYLRYVPEFKGDGILFRSAQNDGVNCVLFCNSDGCVDPDVPPSRPYLGPEHLYVRLRPDTVQCVRIVTKVARA